MAADSPRRAAVLGAPIRHSLSPVLHRAAYAALSLDWSYEAIECDESTLADLLARSVGWAGFSCTMPLKRAVLAVADEVSALAAAVGAGNTLLPLQGGGWRADNTDVTGMVMTLSGGLVRAESVTILGAGGTAQAAVAALVELGHTQCTVLVRDTARTEQVRATADTVGMDVVVATLDVAAPALLADLIISTVPGAAADPLAKVAWRSNQTLLDVVYDPWPTPLAAAAGAAGAQVLSGASMLLHQAAAQVELMTGKPAPVEAMRAALSAALPNAGL